MELPEYGWSPTVTTVAVRVFENHSQIYDKLVFYYLGESKLIMLATIIFDFNAIRFVYVLNF